MKAGAAMAAEKMTRDVVAGEAAIERLSDSMHATVASERQTLNDAVDGMYVIAKAAYGIDDHMVVSSIRTTQDLFERHAAGLAEQVETSQDPDLKAQLEWSAKTAAGWAAPWASNRPAEMDIAMPAPAGSTSHRRRS